MLVRDVMTKEVLTVREGDSLRHAANVLLDRRVSGLPVVDDDLRVVGIVSEADFVTAAGQVGALRKLLIRVLSGASTGDGTFRDTTVGSVMTSPARTIQPDRPLSEAAARMAKWRINRLPVCVNGRLVGIISRADIVGVYARSDEDLSRAVSEALAAIDGVSIDHVREGLVVLSGQVGHRALAEAAGMVASTVEGVIAVDTHRLAWRRDFGAE